MLKSAIAFILLFISAVTLPSFGSQLREYKWNANDGSPRTVIFDISKADVAASEKEYGAKPLDMQSQKVTVSYKVKYNADTSPQQLQRLIKKVRAESEQKIQAVFNQRKKRLQQQGFALKNETTIYVDLSTIWKKNRERIKPYVRQFCDQLNLDRKNLPEEALTFIQSIYYRKPPDSRAGLQILQFLPPVEVLNAAYGDCDTKVSLFASMADDGYGREVIALRGPDHMIAGIETSSTDSGFCINAFGKRFALCECSSTGWKIGKLPSEVIEDIDRGKFSIVRIRPPQTR